VRNSVEKRGKELIGRGRGWDAPGMGQGEGWEWRERTTIPLRQLPE